MSIPDRLEKNRTALLLIDVQDRFRERIHEMDEVIKGCSRLLRFYERLGMPTVATEHYTKGLGKTVPELAELVSGWSPLEKITFSCDGDAAFQAALQGTGRDQIVLCGIETHVCVYQTARDLRARGLHVTVAADATSSQSPQNRELGLQRLRDLGIAVMGVEMILFEILREARTPDFKAVADLLKES